MSIIFDDEVVQDLQKGSEMSEGHGFALDPADGKMRAAFLGLSREWFGKGQRTMVRQHPLKLALAARMRSTYERNQA